MYAPGSLESWLGTWGFDYNFLLCSKIIILSFSTGESDSEVSDRIDFDSDSENTSGHRP